ncbi:MAG: hypothetical protein WC438_05275 [Candidatus Pacearchaeota archaeon]
MEKTKIVVVSLLVLVVVVVLFFFGSKITGKVVLSDSNKIDSIKQNDIYLITSWNTNWGAGVDCTNAEEYGVEKQSIEVYYTTKGDYSCDSYVDNQPTPLSSYNTIKEFNVFESHEVKVCCSDSSGNKVCKSEVRNSFCD